MIARQQNRIDELHAQAMQLRSANTRIEAEYYTKCERYTQLTEKVDRVESEKSRLTRRCDKLEAHLRRLQNDLLEMSNESLGGNLDDRKDG